MAKKKEKFFPRFGELVKRMDSDSIWEVDNVSSDGKEVTISRQGSPLLRWFRVPVEKLRWIERE